MKKCFLTIIVCTSAVLYSMDQLTRDELAHAVAALPEETDAFCKHLNDLINPSSVDDVRLVDERTRVDIKRKMIIASNSPVLLDALKKNDQVIHLKNDIAYLLGLLIKFEVGAAQNHRTDEIIRALYRLIEKSKQSDHGQHLYYYMRQLAQQYALFNVDSLLAKPQFNKYKKSNSANN